MKKSILLAAAVLLAVFCVYVTVTTVGIIRFAEVDETRAADCVIVLGARTSDGEVSPVFAERLRHALELYREGYAAKIILTGGLDPENQISDAEAAKRWMAAEGVPDEDLFTEEQSRYTHENFLYAEEIMEREDFRTALVVSDPLHMKRAMLCARDFGVDGYSSPTRTSMYRSAGTKLPFLIREVGCCIVYSTWRVFGVR